jgi:2-(1,2-epoxy-1,2-dihydrophenyl)acetyl-CoA isomerase
MRITLDRPRRLNAFDGDLAAAFADATLEATGRDDVCAVLIDGAGPAFCAGGDVVAMATSTSSGAELTGLARTINRGLTALMGAPVPVVAAAHGTTAGGGLGILLASDFAVVGSRSKLGSLYANIGLTPDLSVSAQLAAAVGQRRALQLVLQDRLLSAQEAVEWGLVAEFVTGDDAASEAALVRARGEEIARFWLAGAADAYGQAKRLVRSRPERTFVEQLSEEARSIGAALETPDAQARVAAFAATSAKKPG